MPEKRLRQGTFLKLESCQVIGGKHLHRPPQCPMNHLKARRWTILSASLHNKEACTINQARLETTQRIPVIRTFLSSVSLAGLQHSGDKNLSLIK